jgi:hypothetical protein
MLFFDKSLSPFSHTSLASTPQPPPTPRLQSDQFVDATYAPLLLINHGAGVG